MALFDSFVSAGPQLLPQSGGPLLSTQVPAVNISEPRRGLLGGGNPLEARLPGGSSVGTALGHLFIGSQGMAQRRAAQQAERQSVAEQEAFKAAYDPATGKFNTDAFISALSEHGGAIPPSLMGALAKPEEAARPRLFQTRGGDIVAIQEGDDGTFANQTVYDAPEPERQAPMGMRYNEQGVLEWEPGYLEAQLRLADGRRSAVVNQPMPSRAAGGGSASSSGKGGGKPWERSW